MIRIPHSNIPVAAVTHPGMSGKNNEDRFAVSAYKLSRRSRTPVLFAVVADGIGGHRAGEVAAELAVEHISRVISASDGARPLEALHQAVLQASQAIQAMASADPNRQGMGATCACAWIIQDRLYTVSVGDSRIYLMRGGTITQLTTDHTWVQEAMEQGILRPENVRGHPNQHVIRRYLGSATAPTPDFRIRLPGSDLPPSEANQGLPLLEGDRILLCSDGLTDLVENQEILAAFQQRPLEGACQLLVDLANQRGGHDNITQVAVEIPRLQVAEKGLLSKRLFWAALIGAIVLVAAVFLGLVIGLGWLNNRGEPTLTPSAVVTQPTQGLPVILPTVTPSSAASSTPAFTLTPAQTPTPSLTATSAQENFVPPAPTSSGATLTPWPSNTPGSSAPPGSDPSATPRWLSSATALSFPTATTFSLNTPSFP